MEIREVFENFDAKVEGVVGCVEPLPQGRYVVEIVRSERKQNRNGDGWNLEFVFRVREGEYAGRTLKKFLPFSHPNPEAVRFARQTLATLVYACGFTSTPTDTLEMHGIPFQLEVRVREMSDRPGRFTNDIVCWMDARGNQVVAPGRRTTPTQPTQPTQATGSKPSWA